MRIPIEMVCEKCSEIGRVFMDLNANSVDWSCPCGHSIPQISTSNLQIGPLILNRARYELKEQNDIPMSMVLSAMAADCELSRLHFKWVRIAELGEARVISDEELEKQIRSYRSVSDKLSGIARLMHTSGLVDFVANQGEVRGVVETGFPSLDVCRLAETITEVLFWPRNRILHLGQTKYNLEAAKRSFNVATLVIYIY
jgi:hypothetical protein